MTAAPAPAGGVAVLVCGPAGGAGDAGGAGGGGDAEDGGDAELEVALWYHGDRVIDVPPPSPGRSCYNPNVRSPAPIPDTAKRSHVWIPDTTLFLEPSRTALFGEGARLLIEPLFN